MRNFALGFCAAITLMVLWALGDDFATHPYGRGHR